MVSCTKDDPQQPTELTTSWKETDNFTNSGGTPEWHKTDAGREEIIQFKENNNFSSSIRINLNRYILQPIDPSSARLKLYEEGKTDTLHWTMYNITPNAMDVSFGSCVDGCGKRFVRL
jgi:hypothetical protein